MMAMVSELSMHQAHALRLQQEVKEREAELEHAYLRMEKDEAPTEVIEREWMRKIRDDHRRLQDKEASRMVRTWLGLVIQKDSLELVYYNWHSE